jgi:hypothetical protein
MMADLIHYHNQARPRPAVADKHRHICAGVAFIVACCAMCCASRSSIHRRRSPTTTGACLCSGQRAACRRATAGMQTGNVSLPMGSISNVHMDYLPMGNIVACGMHTRRGGTSVRVRSRDT